MVAQGSPAALAGLRFGDQVLQIGGADVAGLSGAKAMDAIGRGPTNGILIAVRDRFAWLQLGPMAERGGDPGRWRGR